MNGLQCLGAPPCSDTSMLLSVSGPEVAQTPSIGLGNSESQVWNVEVILRRCVVHRTLTSKSYPMSFSLHPHPPQYALPPPLRPHYGYWQQVLMGTTNMQPGGYYTLMTGEQYDKYIRSYCNLKVFFCLFLFHSGSFVACDRLYPVKLNMYPELAHSLFYAASLCVSMD